VFLPYGTHIPRADKGSILRPKVYREFEKVTEEMYRRLEGEDEDGVVCGEDDGGESVVEGGAGGGGRVGGEMG